MLKKALRLLFLALPLLVVLEACQKCGPFDLKPFNVHKIDLHVGLRNYQAYVDSLHYPSDEVLFSVNVTDYTTLALQSISLFPQALACSPPDPKSAQRVNSLSIISPDTIIIGRQAADTIVLLPGTELGPYFEMNPLYDDAQTAYQWDDIAEKKPRLNGTYGVVVFWMKQDLWKPFQQLQLRMDLDDGQRLETSLVRVQIY